LAIRAAQFVEVTFSGKRPILQELRSLPGVSFVDVTGNTIRLYSEAPGQTAAEVAYFARSKNIEIEQLCTKKPSLEEVFLYFTSRDNKEPVQ